MSGNKAVLVIDMIYDFLYGKLACKRCVGIIPRLQYVLEKAREKEFQVIYVCDAHEKDDREFDKWPQHAVKGTPGAQIIDELKPGMKDIVVEKTRYSCFYNTRLDKLLHKLKVDELYLTGILTDICVQHTAADAFYRNYKSTVLSDCTESLNKTDRNNSLMFMKQMYNTKIKQSGDTL